MDEDQFAMKGLLWWISMLYDDWAEPDPTNDLRFFWK